MVMMFTEVQPVQAAAPTTGLLVSAIRPRGESDQDWANGFAWRTERCPSWQGYEPCDTLETAPPADGNGIEYHRPVAYRVRDECTTLSGAFDTSRVERMADAVASHVIAEELWEGTLTQANTYDTRGETGRTNNYLARSTATTVGTGPYPVLEALGLLEEAARRDAGGQQVAIHMPIRLVPEAEGALVRNGNLIYTKTGSLVIADSGYTGTGPAGQAVTDEAAWMYATGPVTVRMSTVDIGTDPQSTVDRATNRRTVWAHRLFAATFDPCTHYAIQAALPGAVSA